MFKKKSLVSLVLVIFIMLSTIELVFAETAAENIQETPYITDETIYEEETPKTADAENENQILTETEIIEENTKEQLDANAVSTTATTTSSIPDDFRIEPVMAPAFEYCSSNEAVSMTTGALIFEKTLISLPGRNGFDLDITIRYNSQAAIQTDTFNPATYTHNSNEFAPGWTFGFPTITKTHYSGNPSKIDSVFVFEDGSAYKMLNDELVSYEYIDLQGYQLDDVRMWWRETQNDYVVSYIGLYEDVFDATNGNVIERNDPYGNTITFEYEYISVYENYETRQRPRLSKITDSVGRVTTIEYTESKILFKVNNEIYATVNLSELDTDFGGVSVVSSIADAEGLETAFDYEETISKMNYPTTAELFDYCSNILMKAIWGRTRNGTILN